MQDQVEEEEKNRVIESFCKKITAVSIIENNLPKLPTGYYVEYFRQCERMDYDFHPNILIVSKEKEFINRNTERLDKEEELVRNSPFSTKSSLKCIDDQLALKGP